MKQAMISYMKQPKCDEFITPHKAVEPLLSFIPKSVQTVWEPTDCGKSGIREVLLREGFKVISTCQDFLSIEPDFSFDAIITNPPFSIKDKFLERCYHFNKFFALLMPLTALEGKKRNSLYRKKGINLLVFDRRVEFTDKGNVWFAVGWFFWKPEGENNRLYFVAL